MLITWEDKLHDKMTSAYSKSCGYKKFSVHTNTKKYRFQIVPLWRAFSKSSVFVDLFMRISVDGSRIRNNKVAFSNLSGIVWTGPELHFKDKSTQKLKTNTNLHFINLNSRYKIMKNCWKHNQTERPTFTQLVKATGDFQDSIKVH